MLLTLSQNFADWAPGASAHRADLAAGGLATWEDLVAKGDQLRDAGDCAAAASRYREALAIDDQFAELHFRLATCARTLGEFDVARSHFRRASDLDQVPHGAPTTFNDILRSVAETEGALLVDVDAALSAASPHGLARRSVRRLGAPEHACAPDHRRHHRRLRPSRRSARARCPLDRRHLTDRDRRSYSPRTPAALRSTSSRSARVVAVAPVCGARWRRNRLQPDEQAYKTARAGCFEHDAGPQTAAPQPARGSARARTPRRAAIIGPPTAGISAMMPRSGRDGPTATRAAGSGTPTFPSQRGKTEGGWRAGSLAVAGGKRLQPESTDRREQSRLARGRRTTHSPGLPRMIRRALPCHPRA
jgi:hypothetical protein